jgi:hypothetical protein
MDDVRQMEGQGMSRWSLVLDRFGCGPSLAFVIWAFRD